MTVEALRRRRPETLGELLETYGRELQSVAYLILRDRAAAEDVVIETLLTAFERGGSIRDDRALRAWLLRVALLDGIADLRVRRAVVRADPFGGVNIDVAYFADGSDPLTISLAGLEPGEWIVRVSFNATKGSDTFGGHYDIPLNIAG